MGRTAARRTVACRASSFAPFAGQVPVTECIHCSECLRRGRRLFVTKRAPSPAAPRVESPCGALLAVDRAGADRAGAVVGGLASDSPPLPGAWATERQPLPVARVPSRQRRSVSHDSGDESLRCLMPLGGTTDVRNETGRTAGVERGHRSWEIEKLPPSFERACSSPRDVHHQRSP